MGWLPQSEFDEKKAAVAALSAEQLRALTWEEAEQYTVEDTLWLAFWCGVRERPGITPGEALLLAHDLTGTPPQTHSGSS